MHRSGKIPALSNRVFQWLKHFRVLIFRRNNRTGALSDHLSNVMNCLLSVLKGMMLVRPDFKNKPFMVKTAWNELDHKERAKKPSGLNSKSKLV